MSTPELTIGPTDAAPGGCPTCSHTLAKLTDHDPIYFACHRCGTLVRIVGTHRDVYVPKLVDRCREFYATVTKHAAEWHRHILLPQWRQAGIAESINRPEDRPS